MQQYMDTTLFNTAIKAFYASQWGVNYTKDVEVDSAPDGDLNMYTCRMWLNQPDRPITIAGQFATDDEFLNYVIQELKNKKLPIGMDYFVLIQTDHRIEKKDQYK